MHRSSLPDKNNLISLKMKRIIPSYLTGQIEIKGLARKLKKSFIFWFFFPLIFILFYYLNPIAIATSGPSPRFINNGIEISLNDRKFPVAWSQWYEGKNLHTGIADTGAMRFLGIELLNTEDPKLQPIAWFSSQKVETIFKSPYRYLDLTKLAKKYSWQFAIEDQILKIDGPSAKIKNIIAEKKLDSEKITVFLDRATFWQSFQNKQEAIVNINANTLVKKSDLFDLEKAAKQTKLHFDLTSEKELRISSLSNPHRLVIEFRSDAMVKRNIKWNDRLRWRADYINIDKDISPQKKLLDSEANNFPVVWLEIDPRSPQIKILPTTANSEGINGTLRVIKTARSSQASAAINGGFFNRNNELPLGAIRSKGKWLSGPILNRGAIAWDKENNIKIGRLHLAETLITSKGDPLPIVLLNSAYLKPGIARYTRNWGEFYTPLSDRETIVIVQGDRILRKLSGGKALENNFPIPKHGYLLSIRKDELLGEKIVEGTSVRLQSNTVPHEFSNYTEIIGAGPLLIKNGKNVLNARAEKFSKFFGRQAAIRSAIAVTKEGKIAIVAVGRSSNKKGVTLKELALIVEKIGAVNALNLDGGSSTSLYLGGQLINPNSIPVAKVHNSIGFFFKTSQSN